MVFESSNGRYIIGEGVTMLKILKEEFGVTKVIENQMEAYSKIKFALMMNTSQVWTFACCRLGKGIHEVD